MVPSIKSVGTELGQGGGSRLVCSTKAVMPVKPVFDWKAILPVGIMFIVTAVETVGDISGVMEGGMGREATDSELSGGVICDGLVLPLPHYLEFFPTPLLART